MTYQTNLNEWGETGTEPPVNYSYEEGERPIDAWDNWFNYNVINELTDVIDIINDIDSNTDGVVDEAETANAYKGNDIDSNGDGTVDNSDQFAGVSPSDGSSGQSLVTDGSSSVEWKDVATPFLSTLNIDANKDWQGYNITNLGTLESSEIQNDNYVEGHFSQSVSSSSATIDITNGNTQRLTLQTDTTFGFSGITQGSSNQVTVRLVQDSSGGRTPTFNNVRWANGAPSWSTGANAIDIVSFVYDPVDSIWDGFAGGFNFQ